MFDQPLTNSQHKLRGRKVTDMTDAQLLEWIDACDRMEKWSRIESKARRGWKQSRVLAQAEIERRAGNARLVGKTSRGLPNKPLKNDARKK